MAHNLRGWVFRQRPPEGKPCSTATCPKVTHGVCYRCKQRFCVPHYHEHVGTCSNLRVGMEGR